MTKGLKNGKEEQLSKWTISAEKIRPQSDYKLVLTEPIGNMQDERIILRVKTGLEEDRAFRITNIQPIQMRIHYKIIKVLLYLIASVMLICSVLLAKCMDYAKAWLVMGCILALIWLFAMPYARVPDEESRFFRIYEITQGHVLTDNVLGMIYAGRLFGLLAALLLFYYALKNYR